MKRNI